MEIEKLIIITIISGTLFSLGLILILIGLTFTYRKKRFLQTKEFEMHLKNKELELLSAVVHAQEQERAKIARNLHDEVGAILSIAQQNLSVAIKQIPKDSPFLEDFEFTKDILDQSVGKIRTISHEMLPHFLIKFGLQKSLKRLLSQAEKTLGNSCSFTCTLDQNFQLDQQSEIHFYSISLELLNNVLKHSRPQSLHLFLDITDDYLLLKIKHDGVAISQFDYEYLLQKGDGMGLESIEHRLKLISGEIQYHRMSIGGTVQLAMPII